MKIKGVYKAPLNGKTKGDPVEYSHPEKVPLAVKDAVQANKIPGVTRIVKTVSCADVGVSAKSIPQSKGFANNIYTAKGLFTYQDLKHEGDKLMAPKSSKFSIQFEDCIDEIGQPDLNVIEFKLL